MKITDVQTLLISVPYTLMGRDDNDDGSRPWSTMDTLLVRVDTDAGIVGWGEAFGFGSCRTTKVAIDTIIAPLCIGRDAADLDALTEDLRLQLYIYGRNGPIAYGLSGIDIALWDIRGKIEGAPIHQILGGKGLTRVRAYASLLPYADPDIVAEVVEDALGREFESIKLHEADVPEVEAARRVMGPGPELMLDVNCRWSADEAADIAERLVPSDLKWIEEPSWPLEDYAAMARVAAKVPVAAGEAAVTQAEFEHLIDLAKVSYIQPSVTKSGGISGALRIADLARRRGVMIAPHSPYCGPGLLATIHLCAALPETPNCEWFYYELEDYPFGTGLRPDDGFLAVPDTPGLGLEINADLVARYRVV